MDKYSVGEFVLYDNNGKFYIGYITKMNPEIENEYLIDFNDDEDRKWVHAKYLHKIANADSYAILC